MTLYEFTSAKIAMRRKIQKAVQEAVQEFYDYTKIPVEGKVEFFVKEYIECDTKNGLEIKHEGKAGNIIEYITHIEG